MNRIIALVFLVLLTSACGDTVLNNTPSSLPTEIVSVQPTRRLSPSTPLIETTAQSTATQFVVQSNSDLPPTETGTPSSLETGTRADVTELPSVSTLTWRTVADNLQSPVGLFHAGDGSGRLFILEQPGRILIWQDGSIQAEPFLDIQDRVGSQGFEQGLLGLAFHPLYADNGLFYVNYTDLKGNTVIARFSVDSGNPNRADPATEKSLLMVSQPYANHNGGMLAFGPDGYLYIGLGDGGSAGDPQGNGQSLNSLLGKILRLDIDEGDPYDIPGDNPFQDGQALPEIWAYGLRNPWRFSFDFITGNIFIADVGQNQWEEINYLPASATAGVNFGWNIYEASMPFNNQVPEPATLVFPVFEYDHTQGCSVTGGVVYRGNLISELSGVYLFGDFCSGNVWGLVRDSQNAWQGEILFENQGGITSFGVDEQGEVYLLLLSGQVNRLERE
ncbi:MAG TPA: PQQ-dependent sugar dehydrogenase [Anaerolineales bacterium]|nr:PQQ-dependent sugar dehydrogenase [Anaerolineales bacterium]